MYALNLSESRRVLSATFRKYANSNASLVNELPDGDVSDYLYVDGSFIYSPLPTQETADEIPTTEQRVTDLEEAMSLLLSGVTE